MSHTPGPWHVYSSNGITSVMAADSREVIHWSGFDSSHFPEDVIANAYLIAVAPDLYEACKDFIAAMNNGAKTKALSACLKKMQACVALAEPKEPHAE